MGIIIMMGRLEVAKQDCMGIHVVFMAHWSLQEFKTELLLIPDLLFLFFFTTDLIGDANIPLSFLLYSLDGRIRTMKKPR